MGARTLKSDVPARLPDLICKSRRMNVLSLNQNFCPSEIILGWECRAKFVLLHVKQPTFAETARTCLKR